MTVTAAQLRELDYEELLGRLAEARDELFKLRFRHATGQLDNYASLAQARRDIARIHTVLREHEIAAAEAEEAGTTTEATREDA